MNMIKTEYLRIGIEHEESELEIMSEGATQHRRMIIMASHNLIIVDNRV